MFTVTQFRQAIRDEVGEVAELLRDPAMDRWVNEGQARLRFYRERVADVSWSDGAESVALPTDCHHVERLEGDTGVVVLPHFSWGNEIRFRDPESVGAGSGKLYYFAEWPSVTGAQASLLPNLGDQACVSFALYRFFKRLASSRADYRKYAAIAQSNGVGVEELATLAEQHFSDFTESRDALLDTVPEPSLYYEG